MESYDSLVKALRLCQFGECGCGKCRYKELKGDWCTEENHPEFFDCDDKLKLDAAAAIEELQDKVVELEEELNDVDIAADDNARQVEELQARLGEAENSVERWKDMYLTKHEPKRGELVEVVRCKDCKHRPTGTGVNHDIEFPDARCPCQCYEDYWYSWMPSDDWYCGNGEKMGAQDDKV